MCVPAESDASTLYSASHLINTASPPQIPKRSLTCRRFLGLVDVHPIEHPPDIGSWRTFTFGSYDSAVAASTQTHVVLKALEQREVEKHRVAAAAALRNDKPLQAKLARQCEEMLEKTGYDCPVDSILSNSMSSFVRAADEFAKLLEQSEAGGFGPDAGQV